MDKITAGLLGAVSALALTASAHAAIGPHRVDAVQAASGPNAIEHIQYHRYYHHHWHHWHRHYHRGPVVVIRPHG